jgi:poly(3-hydroxybutyrate) depolymerase
MEGCMENFLNRYGMAIRVFALGLSLGAALAFWLIRILGC